MSTRRRLLTCGVLSALLMSAVGVASPAWAAAPGNDDIGGAVAITEPLPFTTSESTVEATTSAAETALNNFCGAPALEHGVWFSLTPTVDEFLAVDVTASDYSAGILVLTGTPGNLTPINCLPGQVSGPFTAGQTYFLLVFGDGVSPATSGNLELTVSTSLQRRLALDLVSPVEPLTFRLELVDGSCDQGTFSVDSVQANGTAITPLSVAADTTDANSALMVLSSNTPPGTLFVETSCLDGRQTLTGNGSLGWGALAVTKTVEGTPPRGATFTVHVACSGQQGLPLANLPQDFAADLQYQSSGGLEYVYSDHPADCAITEPVNGGASSVTIEPDHIVGDRSDLFTATVTNTFEPPAVELRPTFTG
jgi:hypothetical protein